MNREDIIRMARGADEGFETDTFHEESLVGMDAIERFARLVAAAEREILADWMRQHGFSTGQAYTTATLLDRLGAEMVENTDVAVLAERWECAKLAEETVCDTHLPTGVKIYGTRAAKAIRERSNP